MRLVVVLVSLSLVHSLSKLSLQVRRRRAVADGRPTLDARASSVDNCPGRPSQLGCRRTPTHRVPVRVLRITACIGGSRLASTTAYQATALLVPLELSRQRHAAISLSPYQKIGKECGGGSRSRERENEPMIARLATIGAVWNTTTCLARAPGGSRPGASSICAAAQRGRTTRVKSSARRCGSPTLALS